MNYSKENQIVQGLYLPNQEFFSMDISDNQELMVAFEKDFSSLARNCIQLARRIASSECSDKEEAELIFPLLVDHALGSAIETLTFQRQRKLTKSSLGRTE